ncbi:MAG: methyl-accepting chemotaxis protein [Rhodospirillales bacterium]|nr:methyl-accepting chemotaxis protein [Rhodospirillales bacterium]MCW8953144.1 methyl-accepting chemotaxis protein [Rhodospirillales bacterium]MCW8970155.1 methyl-accepting chemotaxis protein [Rhodospirillales bacterium]MCW9001969.1 methyl-accepting chemotaxis protein [Rhodospirillales bacterium]
MSLSSLSKTKGALIAAAGASVLAEVGVLVGLPGVVELALLGATIASAVVGIWFISVANREFRRTKDVLERAGQGDFEARVLNIREGGDIGLMQNAVNGFIDRSDAYIRESMACQEYVADGKYFRRILPGGLRGAFLNASNVFNKATDFTANKVRDFGTVTDDFERNMKSAMQTVASAATELQSTAQGMEDTAKQTSLQANAASTASQDASSNVQTVASAAEELSASISEIARQANQSTDIAGEAVAEVEGTNEKVQGLAEAANKIGEVVAIITDIAEQTNLLALNATIEAARAGDAGKGFAVVASEVKNLANQTAKATEEISSQIGGIQDATQEAVEAIRSIGEIITKMSEISTSISAAVEEQGAATQEIARNVEQAANGTNEVSSNIHDVTQGADQTGQSAQDVLTAAGELSRQSELLDSEMDKFLIEMRKVL